VLTRRFVIPTLVLMIGSLGTVFAIGEDWPEFRGPEGQGHSKVKGLPVEWSDTKGIAWKQAIPGLGWSSPVVVGGKIFLTTAVPDGNEPAGHSLRVLGLEAATGRVLWNVEVFTQDGANAPKIHGKNSHASPTPIVRDGRVWVHFGHQGTACLSDSGDIIWRNRELQYSPVHGNGGTPTLVRDTLVFSCDGADNPFVVALDAKSGAVRWKTPRVSDAPKKFSFATPLAIESEGKTLVISSGSNSVGAFDLGTGEQVWSVRYQGYSVIPRPVFANGLIYLSTSYDSPSVLAIRPGGKGDVTDTHVAWTVKKGAPHAPSLLAIDKEIYMVSDRGVATCLDALTGEEIWQERLGGNFSASPLYADGKIYFQNETGETFVVRAARTYELLAKNQLANARTLASYAIVDRAILLRTDTHLLRIDADAKP